GARAARRRGAYGGHVPDPGCDHARGVAAVDPAYDPARGVFNTLFATATPLTAVVDDLSGQPPLKLPLGGRFLVRDIFTDLKRHDLGPAFHERNYDGTVRTEFMTLPLWGIASTAPYGHDGRSINLAEVILRHGGEAQAARDAFAHLGRIGRDALMDFLTSLVLFPPDDTASNLDPGNPAAPGFPQAAHGSVK